MNDMIADGTALTASSSAPAPATQSNLPGRLAGTVTLTLHTMMGVGALLGRRDPDQPSTDDDHQEPTSTKRPRRHAILGVNNFAQAIDRIMAAKALDDIYAIQALTEIDDLMDKAEKLLKEERRWLAKKMTANPRMTIQVSYSTDPRIYELDLRSPYAHRAADLIGRYDELVTAALSARRAGIITDEDLSAILDNPRKAIRSSFYKAMNFKPTSVTLEDIKQANARAVDAIAVHGEISPDIISGNLRPHYLH